MEFISKHISFAEATKSQEAIRLDIENKPDLVQLYNMACVANKCFEPLREWYGKPIGISSFFRSAEINKRIGGSATSQHCLGMAIDIDADIFNNGISNRDIFDYLRKNVEFDQLIWEFGNDSNPAWVHISYNSKNNRKQVLKAVKTTGKTQYFSI